VLNQDDERVRGFEDEGPGSVSWFSLSDPVPFGARAENDSIVLNGQTLDAAERILPGWFNLQNMTAAAAATYAATGGSWKEWKDACEQVFRTFRGVEHRLERIDGEGGIRIYNDSIATSPERQETSL
jgi:UDP-N-acetylmuramoylalanine--D-glutamate ligase